MIECSVKGCEKEEDEFHHLIPKFMSGVDLDGRRYLCKKHHNILHKILPSIIWKYVPDDKKEECKKAVKRFSLKFIGEE